MWARRMVIDPLVGAFRQPHFAAVAVLLLVVTVTWGYMQEHLQLAMQAEPIPWPDDVRMHEGEHRLASLPTKLGHFERVESDGLLGEPDGKIDGEVIFEDKLLEQLTIGTTSTDKERYPQRRSNWYLARIYRDTRRDPRDPLAFWHLQIFYYTGTRDTVPHIPERCGVAGGAVQTGGETLMFDILGRGPWKEPVPIRRVNFEQQDLTGAGFLPTKTATYYVFSSNGKPEPSREMVRLSLNNLFQRHNYFAKIQFQPLGAVADLAAVDDAAEKFAANVLPSVLFMLPMPDDVKALEDGKSD
jgi:hypothetical protein